MINGAHVIIYSKDAEADRAFIREVLRFPHVDAGEGWLIFGLPPAELGIHPSEENDLHEFYLMCDDIRAVTATLAAKEVECSPVSEQPWGSLVTMRLPGGGKIGVYEPKHPQAKGLWR